MEEELTPEFGISHLVENGVPREYAERNIWLTDYGKDSILKIYRSAVHIGAEWQPDLDRPLRPARVRRAPGEADEGRAGGPGVRSLVAVRAARGDGGGAAAPLVRRVVLGARTRSRD